ncbi:MAG: hypothetical protein K2F63_06165 [Muribaculaceae bacterium]|nr:hypothetical protein [Muribaculaceae bacterium]
MDALVEQNRKNFRCCPKCGFQAPDDISYLDLHYCGICGSPLQWDSKRDAYYEYECVSNDTIKDMRDRISDGIRARSKLESELYYMKEVKYGSFRSTLRAAFGFVDWNSLALGVLFSIFFILGMGLVIASIIELTHSPSMEEKILLPIAIIVVCPLSLVSGFVALINIKK